MSGVINYFSSLWSEGVQSSYKCLSSFFGGGRHRCSGFFEGQYLQSDELQYQKMLSLASKDRLQEFQQHLNFKAEELACRQQDEKMQALKRAEKQQKKIKIIQKVKEVYKPQFAESLGDIEQLQAAMDSSRHDGDKMSYERTKSDYDWEYAKGAQFVKTIRAKAPPGALARSEFYLKAQSLGLA